MPCIRTVVVKEYHQLEENRFGIQKPNRRSMPRMLRMQKTPVSWCNVKLPSGMGAAAAKFRLLAPELPPYTEVSA